MANSDYSLARYFIGGRGWKEGENGEMVYLLFQERGVNFQRWNLAQHT